MTTVQCEEVKGQGHDVA